MVFFLYICIFTVNVILYEGINRVPRGELRSPSSNTFSQNGHCNIRVSSTLYFFIQYNYIIILFILLYRYPANSISGFRWPADVQLYKICCITSVRVVRTSCCCCFALFRHTSRLPMLPSVFDIIDSSRASIQCILL